MATKRLKVPRASLSVTMLDDPEFIQLCQTADGREALSLFVALLMAAKAQENDGKFDAPLSVVSMMVRWPLDAFTHALAVLRQHTNWLVPDIATITVRSFKKWNSWGGSRDGAGRKPKGAEVSEAVKRRARNIVNTEIIAGRMPPASSLTCSCGAVAAEYHHDDYLKPLDVRALCIKCHGVEHSSDNQTRIQPAIKTGQTVSVSVSGASKDNNLTPPSASSPAKPHKPHWSEPYGSRLATMPTCPKGGPWSFLSRLARDYTQAVAMDALMRADKQGFENWQHVTGWLVATCKGRRDLAMSPRSFDYRQEQGDKYAGLDAREPDNAK